LFAHATDIVWITDIEPIGRQHYLGHHVLLLYLPFAPLANSVIRNTSKSRQSRPHKQQHAVHRVIGHEQIASAPSGSRAEPSVV